MAPAPTPIEQRFWAKVDKRGDDECWFWKASLDGKGYGQLWQWEIRRTARAHRIAYELMVGPIPKGLVIDHLCKNRRCVNPAHLEVVTQQENVMRGDKGRCGGLHHAAKTHCPHGHAYDEANTHYRHRAGGISRNCRACDRERARKRAAA